MNLFHIAISIQRHPIIRVIRGCLVLGDVLVDLSLVLVGGLVDLVADSVDSSVGTSADGSIAVLSNLLVGLLADTRSGALDGLSDVVESLLGGLHCEGSGGCSGGLFEGGCDD